MAKLIFRHGHQEIGRGKQLRGIQQKNVITFLVGKIIA